MYPHVSAGGGEGVGWGVWREAGVPLRVVVPSWAARAPLGCVAIG